MEYIETKILPKGTVIHINGLPCYLEEDSLVTTHKNNWDLISNYKEIEKIPGTDNKGI